MSEDKQVRVPEVGKKSKKVVAAKPDLVAADPSPPADGATGTIASKAVSVRRPLPQSVEFCQTEFIKARFVDAPVRHVFVRSPNGGGHSMLRRVLAGGGEVRLKVILTTLWWAVAEPHEIRGIPASAWAQAFGLERYSTAGAKRVLDGITWLADAGLLEAIRCKGAPPDMRLLREDGSRTPYVRPWEGHPLDADGKRVIPESDRYCNLPRELWEQGWIATLSGPALMCLLIHIDATDGFAGPGITSRDDKEDERPATLRWFHFPEHDRLSKWTVSEDTWRRGNHELVAWKLIERRGKWTKGFRTKRQYFEYRVHLSAFDRSPLEVVPSKVQVGFANGAGLVSV